MKIQNITIRLSLIILVSIFIGFCAVSSLWAATYYVKQSAAGENTGADCANARSLSWFNSNGGNGDTAVLCDDTYTTQISPGNPNQTFVSQYRHNGSGTEYGAKFSGTRSYGAYLDSGDDGTTLDGLYFYETNSYWVYIDGPTNITIQYCRHYIAHAYDGYKVDNNASYIYFRHNTFEDGEPTSASSDMPSEQIRLANCNHILVEENWFGNARHSNINSATYSPDYIVIRNNTFKNEWHHGIGGFRSQYLLVEDNVVYDGRVGGNPYNDPVDNASLYANDSDNSIWRRNVVYNNEYGIYLGTKNTKNSSNVYVYNNTLYNNWMQLDLSNDGQARYYTNQNIKNNIFAFDNPSKPTSLTSGSCFVRATVDAGDNAVHVASCANSATQDSYYATNDFSYNLFYGMTDYFYYPDTASYPQTLATLKSHRPEWHNNITGNPKFNNAASADFTLQSDSPAIDTGTWLTIITSATGSGTTFTVNDAGYFYDGWDISGETGDIIKTQNGAVSTIKSIDYSTHTIAVSPAINVVKGEGLALNYSGSAPDIGTSEYQGTRETTLTPPSPLGLTIEP